MISATKETALPANPGLLIFDLDGTLIDSSLDIAWCANGTLRAFGYAPKSVEYIKANIGWGVKMLLEKLMPGQSTEALTKAREKFLELYARRLTVDTRLYPGVKDTLVVFAEKGKKMAIATNKPEGLTKRILDELGIGAYFCFVAGGDSFANRKPHPEPLLKITDSLGVALTDVIFVGDSPIDSEAGRNAGIFTVGVPYGYRGGTSIQDAGFDLIIKDFQSLMSIIE
ncbi:HAD family hydrolase [bacterium]|nr:MAG: HAD family hydrolase [bacterium]